MATAFSGVGHQYKRTQESSIPTCANLPKECRAEDKEDGEMAGEGYREVETTKESSRVLKIVRS